jgi:aryl-alcohol dehydrogenase-like predicted oxidoreductase
MDDLVSAGKIRHWGVSEWTAEQLDAAVALCRREGLAPPETDQPRYSMLEREIETDLVLDACARHGVGVVVFSPLAQGMLTGKYRSAHDVPPDSRAADPEDGAFIRRFFTDQNFGRVERLREISAGLGITLGQLALAWVLRRPEVSSAIVGATRLAHVEENVFAAEVALDQPTVEAVERALA